MGSSCTKFRRYLLNGDEYAALQIFQSSPELQHSLDPNSSYGDSLKHNTPLHLAAYHAMKPLLRIFLNELKGNANKQNAVGETPLHLVCQEDLSRTNFANQERRVICLQLILQWKSWLDSEVRVNLDAVDDEGNTALHYASASGLKKCVEVLVSHGANLFIENKSSETVCDLAEKYKHEDIAQYLESNMLFYTESCENTQPFSDEASGEEVVTGLRAQDLQEAKDQLLVETSDMFHVPLFTAEVLLRNYEWSRQTLLDAWMKDPIACCKEVGITAPSSALNFSPTQDSLKTCCEQIQNEYQNETLNSPSKQLSHKEEVECDICSSSMPAENVIQVPCSHPFCKECWEVYLTSKIVDGEAHNILCPAFKCSYVVPVDAIEKLVSADMLKRYLHFDIKAFVESNPSMKWCPYPACARAVKIPDMEQTNGELLAISFSTPPTLSHSVDCGNGHYFCWECLGEAHAPCGCEKWREWYNKISEIKPKELKNTYSESAEAENCLWKVTNSKPCPNCKSPIQRNDGCNHMKCIKCKYEFCWACLESWKKHNMLTGGYFTCNRQDALKRAEIKTEASITQAEEQSKLLKEQKRFLQYYSRFKNHESKFKFEEPFIKHMQEKNSILAASLAVASKDQIDMSFLEEAIYELLRARRILCGAGVYGFYLEDNGYNNKKIFEHLQNDLEETAEKLSEVIARTYLQTPQSKILQMVASVKRKRLDLLNAVNKGLIPPETPPGMRKRRRHRLPGLMELDPSDDPLLSQAILDSLKTIDPNDPWVINQHGKHTNIAAVCDWPDNDSDEEDFLNKPFLSSVLGECSREDCKRPRAKNQRTGEIHEYCSLACKHWDILKPPDTVKVTAAIDPAIENLIALEFSKLQLPLPLSNDLNDLNMEERKPSATNVKSLNYGEESEMGNELFQPIEQTDFSQDEDNFMLLTLPLSPLEEDMENDASFSKNLKETTINFYLKNSDDDFKNINTQDGNTCSKTEKQLFKILQSTDVGETGEGIDDAVKNIS